ncbi:hypothetical protein [Rubrivirga sp. IMCC43871]|uniref:hypothetical protein n=1 Tax=Rubrivirga sp. IMCC43871 TaxID=3391575 RepID=UPI0039900347
MGLVKTSVIDEPGPRVRRGQRPGPAVRAEGGRTAQAGAAAPAAGGPMPLEAVLLLAAIGGAGVAAVALLFAAM